MSAMNGIRYPVAMHGPNLVFIEDAREGPFACPGCGGPMVARRGNIRAWHFAHQGDMPCPRPESALHRAATTVIYVALIQALEEGRPYPLDYPCWACDRTHRGDLTQKARAVVLETGIGPVRPDLLLLDEHGSPLAAIEIVVAHPPDSSSEAFYRSWPHPSVFVTPTWESLHAYRQGLPAAAVLGPLRYICPSWRAWYREMAHRRQVAEAKIPPTLTVEGTCPSCGRSLREWNIGVFQLQKTDPNCRD